MVSYLKTATDNIPLHAWLIMEETDDRVYNPQRKSLDI